MTAAMLALEAIFEADLRPQMYACRPRRNAQQQAVVEVEVEELMFRGYSDIVDSDLSAKIGELLQCLFAGDTQVIEQEAGCQKTNQRRQVYQSC